MFNVKTRIKALKKQKVAIEIIHLRNNARRDRHDAGKGVSFVGGSAYIGKTEK